MLCCLPSASARIVGVLVARGCVQMHTDLSTRYGSASTKSDKLSLALLDVRLEIILRGCEHLWFMGCDIPGALMEIDSAGGQQIQLSYLSAARRFMSASVVKGSARALSCTGLRNPHSQLESFEHSRRLFSPIERPFQTCDSTVSVSY
jgi:hypothetical protein